MIPVSIVTGFLGSGKTTLIRRILGDPAFGRTAVIVNEFGEIGLDHELIAASDETLLALTSGCLCCAVRSDLINTLLDLKARREAGYITYDRVLIETSGLADPTPILQALIADADLVRGHRPGRVVTVVDAVHGESALDNYVEARRQVALAERVVLSKTDIAGPSAALRARVGELNPAAPMLAAADVLPQRLLGVDADAASVAPIPSPNMSSDPAVDQNWNDAGQQPMLSSPHARRAFNGVHQHSQGIVSFSLQRDRPVPALALTLFLEAMAEHCGERLLRMKGLVDVAEMPGEPAVIHGVKHVFAAPEFLSGWPSADHTTRLVFITQGVPRHFPARLLEAVEVEVMEEILTAQGKQGS